MASVSVPAAIAIGAGVSGAASVGGALLSSSAAGDAASTQANAANQASQRALDQFSTTRADLAPFRASGTNALNLLNGIFGTQTAPVAPSTTTTTTPGASMGGVPNGYSVVPAQSFGGENASGGGYLLLDQSGNAVRQAATPGELTAGITGPSSTTTTNNSGSPGGYNAPGSNILTSNGLSGLTFQPTQAQLEATPGYQFTRNQGLQSVANSNAATGRGISGAALKGAAKFATGLADNTLLTQQGIFQSNLGNIINPLQTLATLGQNAAVQTGSQGLQAVGNANALTVGGANASAAGQIGSANAISSGLNSVGGAPLNYMLYSRLLGGGGGGGGGYQDTTTSF